MLDWEKVDVEINMRARIHESLTSEQISMLILWVSFLRIINITLGQLSLNKKVW